MDSISQHHTQKKASDIFSLFSWKQMDNFMNIERILMLGSQKKNSKCSLVLPCMLVSLVAYHPGGSQICGMFPYSVERKHFWGCTPVFVSFHKCVLVDMWSYQDKTYIYTSYYWGMNSTSFSCWAQRYSIHSIVSYPWELNEWYL